MYEKRSNFVASSDYVCRAYLGCADFGGLDQKVLGNKISIARHPELATAESGILLIAGPSGSGKTRLLKHLHQRSISRARQMLGLIENEGSREPLFFSDSSLDSELSNLGPTIFIPSDQPSGGHVSIFDYMAIRPVLEALYGKYGRSIAVGESGIGHITEYALFDFVSGKLGAAPLLVAAECGDESLTREFNTRASALGFYQAIEDARLVGTSERASVIVVDALSKEEADSGRINESIQLALSLCPSRAFISIWHTTDPDRVELAGRFEVSSSESKDARDSRDEVSGDEVLVEGVSLADLSKASVGEFKNWLLQVVAELGKCTHHNSKFRFSENILGPYLKVTQSPILAILQYCCGLAQSQLPNMTPVCFQRKRNFELRWVCRDRELSQSLDLLIAQFLQLSAFSLENIKLSQTLKTLSTGESFKLQLVMQRRWGQRGINYLIDIPSACGADEYAGIVEYLHTAIDVGDRAIIAGSNAIWRQAAERTIDLQEAQIRDSARSGNARRRHPAPGKLVQIPKIKLPSGKHIELTICPDQLNGIMGSSGSGKSCLLSSPIWQSIVEAGSRGLLQDCEYAFKKVVLDAWDKPWGFRTKSHSTVGTVSGILSKLRPIYAMTVEARSKGLTAHDFSYISARGCCEVCKGTGLSPNYVGVCSACGGSRFNPQLRRCKYRGMSIAEVLGLSMEECSAEYSRLPNVRKICDVLCRLDLGNLRVGTWMGNASSGQRRRIQLALCLLAHDPQDTLFLLDTPCEGLDEHQVFALVQVLADVVDKGATVVCADTNQTLLSHCSLTFTL